MKRYQVAIVVLIVGVLSHRPLFAQPTAAADAKVVSPEVGSDRKVTFRLRSPGASQVQLTGDMTSGAPVPMTKGADGIWSFTTQAPLSPNIYGYYFGVDGVRTVDPGNLFISSGAEHLKSYVEVAAPPDRPEIWAIRDVPHGQVHEVLYKSGSIGTTRRVIVYTPPGFDRSKRYPAVYLMHGSGDNETYWLRVGRMNHVMDNLIADGKVRPALAISCFGHLSVPPEPEDNPATGEIYSASAIGRNIVEEIIPLIEKEFSGSADAKDRAIFGFSMGGYQSLTIGLNHPETFAYVGGFSFRNARNMDENFKGLTAYLSKSKPAFKLVRFGAGTGASDRGNIAASTALSQFLTGKQVPHEAVTPEGGTHTWGSWREYWGQFMTQIYPASGG